MESKAGWIVNTQSGVQAPTKEKVPAVPARIQNRRRESYAIGGLRISTSPNPSALMIVRMAKTPVHMMIPKMAG